MFTWYKPSFTWKRAYRFFQLIPPMDSWTRSFLSEISIIVYHLTFFEPIVIDGHMYSVLLNVHAVWKALRSCIEWQRAFHWHAYKNCYFDRHWHRLWFLSIYHKKFQSGKKFKKILKTKKSIFFHSFIVETHRIWLKFQIIIILYVIYAIILTKKLFLTLPRLTCVRISENQSKIYCFYWTARVMIFDAK